MKCHSSLSSSSSMEDQGYSVKLRVLILVVNTANLINERATPALGISHALTAPPTLFTTYIFIGIFAIGAINKYCASKFLQIYGLVACSSFQITSSLIIFKELKKSSGGREHAALVLNAILPMINAVLLLVDLIGIIFSNRREMEPPSSSPTNTTVSQSEIQ